MAGSSQRRWAPAGPLSRAGLTERSSRWTSLSERLDGISGATDLVVTLSQARSSLRQQICIVVRYRGGDGLQSSGVRFERSGNELIGTCRGRGQLTRGQ